MCLPGNTSTPVCSRPHNMCGLDDDDEDGDDDVAGLNHPYNYTGCWRLGLDSVAL